MPAIIIMKKRKRETSVQDSSSEVCNVLGAILSLLSFPFLSGQLFKPSLATLKSLFLSEPTPEPLPQQITLLRKETDPICKFRCVHHCLFLPTFFPFLQSFHFKRNTVFFSDNPPPSSAIIFSFAPSNVASHQITYAQDFQKYLTLVSATPPQAATLFLPSFLAKLLRAHPPYPHFPSTLQLTWLLSLGLH